MAVEVDEVVGIARGLGFAQHLLHARQRGRAAEIEADIAAERIERVEERSVVSRGSMKPVSPGRLTM